MLQEAAAMQAALRAIENSCAVTVIKTLQDTFAEMTGARTVPRAPRPFIWCRLRSPAE